eukprot:700628-Ditylum_brightwellii.AAC.1
MGWALSKEQSDGSWSWDELGYWGHAAAGWTGWVGMVGGDECGNTLPHELGHSQTMSHFTDGSAADWGIDDEYPLDGTVLPTHPWGYDTTSRRFRGWFEPENGSNKRDPMNSGGWVNSETCVSHYTAYQGQKAQNWAKTNPVILS